jgi:DNA-binding transcriptional LysR family regulator
MHHTNLQRIDLNLLVAFDALMVERSVTGAARRMFLSQPAMSRTLDRLRATFNDELLIRTKGGYEPTHRASAIHSELRQLLPKIEGLLGENEFDPATVHDVFRIESSDWGATVLVPGLIQRLAQDAPGVQLDVVPRRDDYERVEDNEADLLLTPASDQLTSLITEGKHALRTEPLYRDKLVCVVRSGHAFAHRPLTLKEYLKAQHVSLLPMQRPQRSRSSNMATQQPMVKKVLDRLGQQINVQVRVPYFAPLGPIVENTDLIATVPLEVARRLKTPRTRIIAAPREFGGFVYHQIWHSRNDASPLHGWIRSVMRALAGQLKNRDIAA